MPDMMNASFWGWTRNESAQFTMLGSRMSISSSTTTVILPNCGAKLHAPHIAILGCAGCVFLIDITR